ncbi:hypothetical protein BT93_A0149 [Corymbia citriodora subsp. variegata]|nr:hypothetical protein BT93_A0149 [Corymbia citriodora subsp. variegata]
MSPSHLNYGIESEGTLVTSKRPVCVQLISGLIKVLSGHAIYSWAANNLPESFLRFRSFLLQPKAEEKDSCVEPSTACHSSLQGKWDSEDEDKDADKDGGVSVYREDVEVVMGKLGLFCSHESSDGDSELISRDRPMSCDGISRVFKEEAASVEEVREAFYVFDVNRDQFIDTKELQRVLCALGFDKRGGEGGGLEEDCERMIRVFDEDGDGRIDFQEFVKLVEKCFSC